MKVSGTVTSNAVLVAPASVVDVAASTYPVPALSIDSPLNGAIPPTAFTVFVPARVPFPGFVAMASVTAFVASGTALPNAS